MTIRLVGTCPVCEHQQKVTPAGAMVHHGFHRPGVGHIIGDCPGVGYPAYELSSKGCELYRDNLRETRGYREKALAELQTQPPPTINVYSSFSKTYKTYRRDSEDRNERYGYDQALRQDIQNLKYSIRAIDEGVTRMGALIERWAPAPLVEIDEEGLTPAKREERTARKTERDAKRAEKERARLELQVKRNERLARRATQLLFFRDEFERLAALPPSTVRDNYAHDLLFEAQKKKYGLNYPHDLFHGPDNGYGHNMRGPWGREAVQRAERTLVALGLARVRDDYNTWTAITQVYKSTGNKIRVPEPDSPAGEVLDRITNMPPLV